MRKKGNKSVLNGRGGGKKHSMLLPPLLPPLLLTSLLSFENLSFFFPSLPQPYEEYDTYFEPWGRSGLWTHALKVVIRGQC